jgi:BetI-type transcriptional repressor, C-terminal
VDPERVADHAMALLDGAGLRALLRDPAMDLERARSLVADRLAAQLGVDPAALL